MKFKGPDMTHSYSTAFYKCKFKQTNKNIATRPGRLSHVSSQGLETDQSLSTCFNFIKSKTICSSWNVADMPH